MVIRLFASGFRPAFLAAGLAALCLIPTWVLIWGFGAALPSHWPPTIWHAHEMLFGFLCAAVAGFLLTAVPGWTGHRAFAGWPLVALIGLWFAGRILVATSDAWPALLVAFVDASFLPCLALMIGPMLLRSRNRNTPMLLVLASLATCNAVSHWAVGHQDPQLARHAILIGIDIVLLLVTVIGGRIVPAFTANALRASGSEVHLRAWPRAGSAAVLAMLLVLLTDLFQPSATLAGVVAGLAALAQGLRLLQWRTGATLRQPIVWILHLAYGWLPIGLALKCIALLWGLAWSAFWLHALTIGALAEMTLGVMSRASLGHTGRPLRVDPLIVGSYVSLLAAALVRVFGLGVAGMPYAAVIVISAACWTVAFALFLVVYAPILLRERADGKPG